MTNIPFEDIFKKATEKYWQKEQRENQDFFLWFASQAKAESAFDPKAISPVGACGTMQIMPLTWREIRLSLPHLSRDIFDISSNIEAGVWYCRFCYERFRSVPNGEDRLLMAFAAYNCGPTRIRRLIEKHLATDYPALESHIPYSETVEYVRRIVRFHEAMSA
jgi:soluble lytic murein transglycosylase-like protein